MSTADRIASFPTSAWTGSSSNRADPSTEVSPYSGDYDKICAEVIALENYILSHSGASISLTADVAVAVGTLVYVKSNGHIALAIDTNLTTSIYAGFCVVAPIASGSAGLIQVDGLITYPTATWDLISSTSGGLVTGAIYYVGSTAGTITSTATSTSTKVANICGVALSATTLKIGVASPILIAHA